MSDTNSKGFKMSDTKSVFVPKILKNVTLPLLKIADDRQYYFKFLTQMALGKQMPAKPKFDESGKPIIDKETGEVAMTVETPATVAQVLNLEDNHEYQILCATVFNKELLEGYPGHTYVGKCFAVVISKANGKRYKIAQIQEIEDPTATAPSEDTATETKPAKKK